MLESIALLFTLVLSGYFMAVSVAFYLIPLVDLEPQYHKVGLFQIGFKQMSVYGEQALPLLIIVLIGLVALVGCVCYYAVDLKDRPSRIWFQWFQSVSLVLMMLTMVPPLLVNMSPWRFYKSVWPQFHLRQLTQREIDCAGSPSIWSFESDQQVYFYTQDFTDMGFPDIKRVSSLSDCADLELVRIPHRAYQYQDEFVHELQTAPLTPVQDTLRCTNAILFGVAFLMLSAKLLYPSQYFSPRTRLRSRRTIGEPLPPNTPVRREPTVPVVLPCTPAPSPPPVGTVTPLSTMNTTLADADVDAEVPASLAGVTVPQHVVSPRYR